MTSTHNAVIFRDFGMISQFICDHIGYATHLVQMETTPFLEDLISDEFHHQQQLIDSAPHDSCQRSYSVANECEKENFPVTSQSAVVQTEMNAVQDVTLVADRLLLRKGSVRGVKNIVKNNKSELLQQSVLRKYERSEEQKIVVYVTCLGIVRTTWENCRKLVAILENNNIQFERRDLLFNKHYVEEFKERMEGKSLSLPQMFVEGKYFGGLEAIEKLNEQGILKQKFLPFVKWDSKVLCPGCYGFRYVPCPECHGGKKSRSIFVSGNSSVQLKCTKCDAGGLAACDMCRNGYLDI